MTDHLAPAADLAAITELKAKYCHFVDTKRWADLGSIFTVDAELHKTADGATTVMRGRDTITSTLGRNLATRPTMHYATNPLIELTSPDTAVATWCALWMDAVDGSTGHGWYEDRCVKVDGAWSVERLTLTVNFLRPGR
jgi:hypothetical protein